MVVLSPVWQESSFKEVSEVGVSLLFDRLMIHRKWASRLRLTPTQGLAAVKLMVTVVTKGGTQKLPQKNQIVESYWHDHSLESSSEALSDSTISFSINPFQGDSIFWIFLKNLSLLIKELTLQTWISKPPNEASELWTYHIVFEWTAITTQMHYSSPTW
jgi:hypothetical protein